MSSRRGLVLVLTLGLFGSQAGHLLAYGIRFGAAAGQIQSSGPHAYFPIAAKTGLGAAAAFLIFGLFVIGLARSLNGSRQKREQPEISYLSLLSALFTVQLAFFAGQESLETYLASAPTTSPAMLLLWGTLGQLPVAVVSALAIRWLLARFAEAVTEIRAVVALVNQPPRLVPVVAAIGRDADRSRLLARVAGRSLAKRGPPSLRRPSSN